MDPEKDKLDNLVERSNQKLIEITTVFPFQIFPTLIRVDTTKIMVVHKIFFSSEYEVAVLIKDIKAIRVTRGVWFATILIDTAVGVNIIEPTNFLLYNEAMRVRNIVTGLIACDREGIDLSQINTIELTAKVEEIGRAR